MTFEKSIIRLFLLLCWIASAPLRAQAQVTSLYQSVEQALVFSPQLQALTYDNEAIKHDLKQTRGRYGPSIDVLLGYGTEQHSDKTTRQADANPSGSQWSSRGDATLRLTQKVYDGGETSQAVSIQQAILNSANYDLQTATQAIALDAISAHLDVYRQRELVALAEKDLQVHEDIYKSLSEIERAGAGNIADVTQTQTRLARARSILIISQGDLRKAISNYERVVGIKPEELSFAGLPTTIPGSLDDTLKWMEQKNPALMASNARLMEANARVDLARSAYMPKVNIELNSRYHDQLEGDPSYQYTNDAMLVMRWNLFNGGQDKESTNAALSRKYQSRSNRDGKLIELRDATAAAWATYLSLQSQKKAFRDAVASSEQTFDAYLKQFSVFRRSLLDVLDAEKEYFQSARQLVSVSVDEIIAAYRILGLIGTLQVLEPSDDGDISIDLSRLAQAIELPSVALSSNSVHLQAPPSLPPAFSDPISAATQDSRVRAAESKRSFPAKLGAQRLVEIGPCIHTHELEQAKKILHRNGLDFRQSLGIGMVKFTRLLEGVYTVDEAHRRLDELKKTMDAFVLPEKDKLAIYVGSFHDHEKANSYARRLAAKNIAVTPVVAEVERQGTMLVVQSVDERTAAIISKQMSTLGLTTITTHSHQPIK